ncbi:MAG: hypothetical protein JWO63_2584 [Frankiales bacterium]|nr:hypothetical protein [Frankiales bacterium]
MSEPAQIRDPPAAVGPDREPARSQEPPSGETSSWRFPAAAGGLGAEDALRLQQTAGNRAVRRLARERQLQRQEAPRTADPPTLDQRYRAALAKAREDGFWQDAAELLNGFNTVDIRARVAELTRDEVGYLHAGALDNPRVGPESNVAALTTPRAAVASVDEPRSTQLPAPPRPAPSEAPPQKGKGPKPVADMSAFERLSRAIDYAREARDGKMDEQLKALKSPQSIFAMVVFAGLFIGAQVTPVGWIADALALAGLTLAVIFIGATVFHVAADLGTFASATYATTEAELQDAGEALADAVAIGGITLVTAIFTHAAGKIPPGSRPFTPPPIEGFQDAITADGQLVRVPVEAVEDAPAVRTQGGGAPPKEGAAVPKGEAEVPKAGQNTSPAPVQKKIPAQVPGEPPAPFEIEMAEESSGTYIWSRQTPAGKVLINGTVEVSGATAKVRGVHTGMEDIAGKSLAELQNKVGIKELLRAEADFARYIAGKYGVKQVEIYPGTRTTPGFEGKTPRPRFYTVE